MSFIPEPRRYRFILVEPSHPGNIGACARAIQTMGFCELWVVKPFDPNYKTDSEALAFATHSANILEQSHCVETLEEALSGVTKAYAMTGYDREFGPRLKDLCYCCEDAKRHVAYKESGDVAFVFGTERSGLTNRQIEMCQLCAAIPANPECDSLNLSQAVQVTAYQLQMTLRGKEVDAHAHRFNEEPPADVQSLNMFFNHLEEAMISCGALDPKKPKFMMERLKRLFSKGEPSQTDVNLLRGICAAIICPKKDRQGRKISDKISRK